MKLNTIIAIGLCSVVSGCGTSGAGLFTPRPQNAELGASEGTDSDRTTNKIDYTGVSPVIKGARIEPINLLIMLDPEYQSKQILEKYAPHRKWSELTYDERYEYAFEAFSRNPNATDVEKAQRRNRVQDRIVLSSDQRCGIYRRMLLSIQSDANFWLGTGATIAGVLGPLFGERGAKNLAVLAGGLSGTRAEVSQSYFYNLAVPVITKGIDERRKSILERMRLAHTADIHQYTVQAAVKDAVYYDGQCSVISGLEEAAEAIRLVSDPGIESANRILLKTKLTKEIVSANTSTEIAALDKSVRMLEANPLMVSNRFSNIGVPLAGVGGAMISTPSSVAVLLAARRQPDVNTAVVHWVKRARDIWDKRDPAKTSASATLPADAEISQSFDGLKAAYKVLDEAAVACVAQQTGRIVDYAKVEAAQVSTDSTGAATAAAEQLALWRRESEQVQRVLMAARSDLDALADDWQSAWRKGLADGKSALPSVPDKALVSVTVTLKGLMASPCKPAG